MQSSGACHFDRSRYLLDAMISLMRPMREELIAYVLDELDDTERLRVEQLLADNRALDAELAQIRECLAEIDPADRISPTGVPRGLADRTTKQILACCEAKQAQAKSVAGRSSAIRLVTGENTFSLVDLTVIGAVLVMLGALVLPGVQHSRSDAQRLACVNNLKQLYPLFVKYADNNLGFYPVVRPEEHAGIYALRLKDAELATAEALRELLVCPASPLAEELRDNGTQFKIPSLADLARAKGPALLHLYRNSGGSYGYQIGYVKGHVYLPSRNRQHARVPILADAPSLTSQRQHSANHGGKLINVLFQDGSVLTLTSSVIPCSNDHLFFNAVGEPFAGFTWQDAVVLPSESRPGYFDKQLPNTLDEFFRRP